MEVVNEVYLQIAITTKIIMSLIFMGKFQDLICFSLQFFKA